MHVPGDNRCVSWTDPTGRWSSFALFLSDVLAGESQPTQLLQNVLDSAYTCPDDSHTSVPAVDDLNVSNDFSSDSHTSRNSNSAPRYHFHGLAATQTQTQHEESGENEGSQKENISTMNTSGENKQSSSTPFHPRSTSPHASSSKNSAKEQPPHVDQLNYPSCATANKVCQ
jgi:hypothetical protein